jgi:hypothetical protein
VIRKADIRGTANIKQGLNRLRKKSEGDANSAKLDGQGLWGNPPKIDPNELKNRTLTNLYNKRPEWLANAHRDLDEAVFAAYGWPADLTKEEILARLLKLNHERAGAA